MAHSKPRAPPGSLQRRLLNDIAEIKQDPYPNVHLHFDDANIYNACLILTPDGHAPLHLSITFPYNYPLVAPIVTIQTRITHPNVYGSYICASILNTTEGWTSAYTLKGIVIQLLSFFCSDSLEQDYGGHSINIADFQREYRKFGWDYRVGENTYQCRVCGFCNDWKPTQRGITYDDQTHGMLSLLINPITRTIVEEKPSKLFMLPDETILSLLAQLETRDVLTFADAVPMIKNMVCSYDFIRIRELQCFCLKRSFMDTKLGIGVSIQGGRRPVLRSEFDLLSQEAFFQHGVHRSIQGVRFDRWLPLPLSRRHWKSVKTNAMSCLEGIHSKAKMTITEPHRVDVLYHFMNSVVVQFSADAEKGYNQPDGRSTLSHASEKAVAAYFGLFHLLLCIATENSVVVGGANRIVARFTAGPRTKAKFPDLGHVLVATLISDSGLTEELTLHIVKEAILRNVVWMLDVKGAGMAELAYLEPSSISHYRLVMTFAGSPTSYRLLMFLKLFSSAARPPHKSLVVLRDELFDTHGAPPPGTSTIMDQRIRKIREIDCFPGFLSAMGIKRVPSKSEFTAFLRRTITDSVKAGYSSIPLNQSQLYMIRKVRERNVEITDGIKITPGMKRWYENGEKWYKNGGNGRPSFFPNHGSATHNPNVSNRVGINGRISEREYGRGE